MGDSISRRPSLSLLFFDYWLALLLPFLLLANSAAGVGVDHQLLVRILHYLQRMHATATKDIPDVLERESWILALDG